MSLREDILNRKTTKKVEISEEAFANAFIRKLTLGDRVRIQNWSAELDEIANGPEKRLFKQRFIARVAACALSDEAGTLAFNVENEEDIVLLMDNLAGTAGDELVSQILDYNNVSGKSVTEGKPNSGTTPSSA